MSANKLEYPFVQKARQGGYDGRGVSIIRSEDEVGHLLQVPSIVEKAVDIQKEIAIIASRNTQGDIVCYDPVEMVFNPEANLVDYLFAPASLPDKLLSQAMEISTSLIQKLNIVGLLAIEFFVDQEDNLLVNEVAPRPHNSGHHSIEACVTSQFQQHLRAVMGFPLGSTRLKQPAMMINVLGEENHNGTPVYDGIEKLLSLEDVHIHLYGKRQTRPFRKMGHINILGKDLETCLTKKDIIQSTLKVIT